LLGGQGFFFFFVRVGCSSMAERGEAGTMTQLPKK
jgi:hypothetical protein